MTRDQKLKRIAVLWAKGLSTGVIAKQLGLPKGTVCGAALRARLRGDPRFPERDHNAQPTPMLTPKPTPIPTPIVVVAPAPKRAGPMRILDLEPADCKFAVQSGEEFGDHWFCAEPRASDSPYCVRHHHAAHTRSN